MKLIDACTQVEKWGLFEVSVSGPNDPDAFTHNHIRGIFRGGQERVEAEGFYDGEGIYKVRFMPSFEGHYEYELTCDFDTQALRGSFQVLPAGPGNHGPVGVANTCHLAYADGTPYYSIGTTCYVWELQCDERIEQTLETLKNSAFNKIRFCIFPKHYDFNLGEPRDYPYEGTPMDSSVLTPENFSGYGSDAPGNDWDFDRFRPSYFRHIERCIMRLGALGIEADLILMHPYDRWGFSKMDRAHNDLYLSYVAARFSALRNVWWSLANEYDLCAAKTLEDWEHFGNLICEKDPYHHLRSIHNCKPFYDFSRPWVTHCSIQRQDFYRTAEYVDQWRAIYKKPVVLDELAYEGNISHGWGNISGQEMVRRFWEAACRGGYAGHGETLLGHEDVLWWSHGGKLWGESHRRLSFLHEILRETPCLGLRYGGGGDEVRGIPDATWAWMEPVQSYYLIYYSFMCPSYKEYYFDDTTRFRLMVLDTWNMTREDRGIVCGRFRVELPGRPYMAIQLKKVTQEAEQ